MKLHCSSSNRMYILTFISPGSFLHYSIYIMIFSAASRRTPVGAATKFTCRWPLGCLKEEEEEKEEKEEKEEGVVRHHHVLTF